MRVNKIKPLKDSFKREYGDKVIDLYRLVFPLLEKGWSEEKMFDLFVFMNKNPDKIKGKNIQEISKIFETSQKGDKI